MIQQKPFNKNNINPINSPPRNQKNDIKKKFWIAMLDPPTLVHSG